LVFTNAGGATADHKSKHSHLLTVTGTPSPTI